MLSLQLQVICTAIATILSVFQYVPYVVDIIRNRTKPHAFSWFAWGLPTIIVFFAQLSEKGGVGSLVTGITGFTCTLIFVLALFRGEKDIRALDWLSFACSLIGIGLWAVTHNPLWAVLLMTSVDLIGFVPTIRKSHTKPHEETRLTYFAGGLKWIFSIAALDVFNATTLMYPLAMIVANWSFVSFLTARRVQLNAV